jgi:hypothetical protein
MTTAETSEYSSDAIGIKGPLPNGASAETHPLGETTQQTPGSVANGNGLHGGAHAPQRDPTSGLVNQWHSQPRTIRIIHVGAGATGLCAAYKMRNQLQNYELVCYEKNASIGGTWLESMISCLECEMNKMLTSLSDRYPGCACDV